MGEHSEDRISITIKKEYYDFLKHLSECLDSQDNCGTAEPYFYVIRTPLEVIVPQGWGNRDVYIFFDESKDQGLIMYSGIEEYIKDVKEGNVWISESISGLSEEEVEKLAIKKWDDMERYGLNIDKYVKESNIFFTREALDKHMEVNGHNLSAGSHPYVKYAYRNKEMETLVKFLREFKNV